MTHTEALRYPEGGRMQRRRILCIIRTIDLGGIAEQLLIGLLPKTGMSAISLRFATGLSISVISWRSRASWFTASTNRTLGISFVPGW